MLGIFCFGGGGAGNKRVHWLLVRNIKKKYEERRNGLYTCSSNSQKTLVPFEKREFVRSVTPPWSSSPKLQLKHFSSKKRCQPLFSPFMTALRPDHHIDWSFSRIVYKSDDCFNRPSWAGHPCQWLKSRNYMLSSSHLSFLGGRNLIPLFLG